MAPSLKRSLARYPIKLLSRRGVTVDADSISGDETLIRRTISRADKRLLQSRGQYEAHVPEDGGGGGPEWLPDGAVAHLDFGEGNYYADGAEQLPATLIDGFMAEHITAGVYSPPSGTADLLAGLLASVTDPAGFTFVFEGTSDSNNLIIRIADVEGEEIYIYTEESAGVIVEEGVDFETAQSDVGYTVDDPITFAATFSPAKLAVSDRGGATVATVIDPETQWFEWTDATFSSGIGYRVVTIYAPLADGALPALSAP